MKFFYVAALTGRSGTGKSLASVYLSKKGIPVIDGDDVAREVVVPPSKCLNELVKEFSDEILSKDGTLDRKALADISFGDRRKKEMLDRITHPYIIESILEKFEMLHKEGYKYCVVEAAALIESGLYANCDKIVLITSSRDNQISRIIRRDGISAQQAEMRIDAQVSDETIMQLADYVIENSGTQEEFHNKLDELINKFEEWFS